jgi:hypothetical protein
VAVTVKGCALESASATCTRTSPEVAPDGTVATIPVFDQDTTVMGRSPIVTDPPLADGPKRSPVRVSEAPT